LFTCIEFFIAMFTSVGFLREMIFEWNVHQCRNFCLKCSALYNLRYYIKFFTDKENIKRQKS
jgi:hypothetical protein